MKEVIEFARKNGYETAVKAVDWNGYECYEPVMDKDEISYIGAPLVILVKDNTIRMSTVEEAFQRIKDLPDEDED